MNGLASNWILGAECNPLNAYHGATVKKAGLDLVYAISVRHQLVVQTHFYSNQSTTLAIDVIGYTGQENIKTSPTFKSPPTTIAVDIFPNLATISHKWRRRRLNWLLD